VCLLVTKLALIALYYKFKQFIKILIHIFTILYYYENKSYSNLEFIPLKMLMCLRILHFTISHFVNAVLNKWPMSDVTN